MPIFKNDNAVVFIKIEEDARRTSVELAIKCFSRRKDGRGDVQTLIDNHSRESKHSSISKKQLHLSQSIK